MNIIINELYELVEDRKKSAEVGSYTKYLFDKGIDKILKKVGEESTEVIISAKGKDKVEQINEICDLSYHLIVLMVELGISLEDIKDELIKRRNKISNFKGEQSSIEII